MSRSYDKGIPPYPSIRIDQALASAGFEYLFGLDREAKSYFGRSVENLKEMANSTRR